jgi:serine/threonine protein phosphatase PrpC
MSTEPLLGCPVCGAAGLAGDTFCEACGAEVGAARDAARHHAEIDRGTMAGITDRGLVHRRNEDAVHLESGGAGAVLAVCDGVSSSTGSEVAAQVAAEELGRSGADALRRREDDPDGWDAGQVVREAVGRAVDTVVTIPWMDDGGRDAPSCTVVMAVWDGTDVTVGWLGDSRAYWVDEAGCRQLTVDHSWAEEQISAGRLDRESAEADSRAHAITRWAGADAPPGPCPIASLRPRRPGRLIVCTDGLWNYTPMTEDLARLVAAHGDATPSTVARSLVRHALAHGGHDNVTVAVAEIVPPITTALEGA